MEPNARARAGSDSPPMRPRASLSVDYGNTFRDKVSAGKSLSESHPTLMETMMSTKTNPSPPFKPTAFSTYIDPLQLPPQLEVASRHDKSSQQYIYPTDQLHKEIDNSLQIKSTPTSNVATFLYNHWYHLALGVVITAGAIAIEYLRRKAIDHKEEHVIKNQPIFPPYTDAELKVRKEFISPWFDAFYKYTDEKSQINTSVYIILSLLRAHRNDIPWLKNLTVLDIGCCGSSLHVMIAERLVHHSLKGENVHLIGLDKNSTAINLTKKDLDTKHWQNFTSTLEEIDFFKKDSQPEYLTNILYKLTNQKEADIIFASHVFYYSEDVGFSVNATLAVLSPIGVAVYIHETALSFGKLLPIGCRAPVNWDTNYRIKQTLAKHSDINFYLKTLTTKISPPVPFKTFIQYWQENNRVPQDPEWQTTKYLVEFMFQMPLEVLINKPELSDYLSYGFRHLSSKDDMVIHSQVILVTKSLTLSEPEQRMSGFYDAKDASVIKDELVEDFIIMHAQNINT